MSLATTIGAGTLLGGLLAVGVYTAIAPSDAVPASAHVVPTYAPVPTPTVTAEAKDCVAPAVLEDDECVVHQPGPTVTLPAVPAPAPSRTHDATTGPLAHDDADEQGGSEAGDDDSQGEDQESEDQQSEDHESEDHEDGGQEDTAA